MNNLFIAISSIIKTLTERNNKFYVVIKWGNSIPDEHMLIKNWKVANNLLTLYKKNYEYVIVLDKTQSVLITLNKTNKYPNINKDEAEFEYKKV